MSCGLTPGPGEALDGEIVKGGGEKSLTLSSRGDAFFVYLQALILLNDLIDGIVFGLYVKSYYTI